MKTLEEIKNEVARELYQSDFNLIQNLHLRLHVMDKVCHRYAQEALNNAAENAVVCNIGNNHRPEIVVDKSSITDASNIVK